MKMPSASDEFVYGSGQKTRITSLIGGGQIFDAIDDILKKANKSVSLNMYNIQSPELYPDRSSPDGTPGAAIQAGLVNRLAELNNNGYKVKIVLDHHDDKDRNELYNDKTIDFLRSEGVEVQTYPRDVAKINHVKVLIVDNKYAVVGGMNWGNHSAANHDAALLIEGPDVRNIYNELFKNDWLTSGGKAKDIPTAKPFDQGKIKVMTTTTREAVNGPDESIFEEILAQIGKAQDSIYAELFVLTQKDVVDNLLFAHRRLTAAGKEGVKLLVDPGLFFAFPNTRKGIQKLARAGIPIKFYSSDRDAEEKLHSKWAVFDQKNIIMGSANWSAVGLNTIGGKSRYGRGNHEAAILVESEKVAKPFVQQMLYDWKYMSFPILEFDPKKEKWVAIRPNKGNQNNDSAPKIAFTGTIEKPSAAKPNPFAVSA